MIFQREKFTDVISEILPLAKSGFAEVEDDQDKIPFDLSIETFVAAEEQGNLVIYTGRHNGQLMAYAMFIIMQGLHSKNIKYAVTDMFYVRPEARGRVSMQMVDYAEENLRNVGVQVIHYHVKDNLDWSSLIARRNFKRIETVWQKWVGE